MLALERGDRDGDYTAIGDQRGKQERQSGWREAWGKSVFVSNASFDGHPMERSEDWYDVKTGGRYTDYKTGCTVLDSFEVYTDQGLREIDWPRENDDSQSDNKSFGGTNCEIASYCTHFSALYTLHNRHNNNNNNEL